MRPLANRDSGEGVRRKRNKGGNLSKPKKSEKLKIDPRANNPLKYGLLSKRDLLPWEDHAHFRALHKSLVKDFAPTGVVERHLVEELASIIWRKHRIGPAESAQFYLGMLKPTKPLIDASTFLVEGQKALFAAERLTKLEEMADAFNNLADPGNAAQHRDVSRNVDAEQLVLLGATRLI